MDLDSIDSIRDSVDRIAELSEYERALRARMDDAIKSARYAGHSWAEIGGALGVSRQAAHERFRHLEG